MNWLLFSIISIISRGTMSIATKMMTNRIKVSPLTQSTLFIGLGGVLVIVCSPLLGGIHFDGISHHIPAIAAIIALQSVANMLYFKAQDELEAGVTQIAFSSILVWNSLLSIIFLQAHFSATQVAGIGLLLGAILMAQYTKNVRKFNPAITLIVITTAMYAGYQIISAKLSTQLSTTAYLIPVFLGTAAVSIAVRPRQFFREVSQLKPQARQVLSITLFASTMSVLNITFLFLAFKHAPSQGVVAVLSPSQVIVAVLLGMLFLNERKNKVRKLLAASVAVLAGVLIKS